MCDGNYCRMQPDNMGLQCNEQENSVKCKFCGWNPEVAKQRRKETLEKQKENEK